MTRTRGWSGAAPTSDSEAAQRILAAAKTAIDRDGGVNIADIARAVGVTRQTIYRYFPSTDALLMAAAMDSASGFLDKMAAHLGDITDPATAVVEGVAYTLESLPGDPYMRVLLSGRSGIFSASVTSDAARELARTMLDRYAVDWAAEGFTDADLDDIAEHMLRTLQSFLVDPGRPPRVGPDLRDYLRRWDGAAIEHRRRIS
ncbi:TetR/AcrR family transcriptional regulator [Mycolicibacterium sp.]|uniref:TetR/AcrR family transcriptional regulator n=1 Tax=Mycolicibacterium sp. TaxID=2320850 RepID=UPI003D0C5139